MKAVEITVNTVDEYIAGFPEAMQEILQAVRDTIKSAAPEATELISYRMPAYKYHGVLVYFAGYKKHIGFYATPSGHAAFKKELALYKEGKGSVQFPNNQPVPLGLISRIVKYRVNENLKKKKNL
jgi:uncharacterized protein YdhG (YjbR/CyaY superfamily)